MYATKALTEELECNPGTRCNCLGSNLTVMSCNISNGVFTLPIDLSPQLRSVKIAGRNYSIHISNSDYGDSWQRIENLEIFGDDGKGDLRLRKTFTDKLSRVKLFRITNAGLRSIDRSAFSNMISLEHLDISNNAFLNIHEFTNGLFEFKTHTLKTVNISGIHSGNRMEMFSIYFSLLSRLLSVNNLDMSWTRGSVLVATFELLPELRMLNISGTHLFQSLSCIRTLTRLEHLHELRMDYWPTTAISSRRPRASRNETNINYTQWWSFGCRNVSYSNQPWLLVC